MSEAAEMVKKYVEDCPDVPTLTLAKTLYAHRPDLFSTVEHARSRVRYYRGNNGDALRQHVIRNHPELMRPNGSQSDGDMWANLPKAIAQLGEWEPRPIAGTKALLVSDLHIPYHHEDAVRAALQYGYESEVDTIIIDGDLIDFYQISRWEKDPRLRNTGKEIEGVRQFLAMIRNAWPNAGISFKLGNHDERWELFMRRKAPELLDMPEFELDEVLCLEQFGVDLIPSRQYATFGKLPILHGHEFGRSVFSPVNPARGYWTRAKESMIAGHLHQSSSHSENRLSGDNPTTFSLGCLCDLHPEYAPLNRWNHGFAIIELVSEDGDYQVHNKKMSKGKVFNA